MGGKGSEGRPRNQWKAAFVISSRAYVSTLCSCTPMTESPSGSAFVPYAEDCDHCPTLTYVMYFL